MSEPAPAPLDPAEAPKLDVLALPSYTAILFGLIALVVLGSAFASLLPGSQLWWPPVVLGLTLLTLRDYLRRPALWMRRMGLAPGDAAIAGGRAEEAQALGQAIQRIQGELVDLAGEHPAPLLTVSPQRLAIHAFGTARQRYVGIGAQPARRLAHRLQSHNEPTRRASRAVLAHELAHFLNGDLWMVGLSYSLLKMMVLVMLANLWVSMALSVFIIEVSPEVLQPAFWQGLAQFVADTLPGLPPPDLSWVVPALRQENPAVFERLADPSTGLSAWEPFFVFLVSVHLPFVVSGAVLFGLYWRRLLRVRELYADARAAALVGDARAVPHALALEALIHLTPKPPDPSQRLRRRLGEWSRRLALQPHFALHPRAATRTQCLEQPQQVFGSWRSMAVSVGLAVVLLDLVLRGALTAGYIYQPGAHLTFAAAFLAFSLWLLPQHCLGQRCDRHLGRRVVGMVLLFTAIKLAPYVLDLAAALLVQATDPVGWGRALDLWIYGLVGASGEVLPPLMGVEVTWSDLIRWHILAPMAYFASFMPPVLLASLWLDAFLKRRTLTWYRLAAQVRWAWAGITAVVLGVLLLAAIPVGNRLYFPWVYTSWSTVSVVSLGASAAAVVLSVLGLRAADRRWGGRCGCGETVPGPFTLGRTCPRCHQRLHEWLIASY